MIKPYIVVENKFTPRAQRLVRKYRSFILKSMSDFLDQVRKDSIGFIIPSKDPSNRTGFTRMYKNQPSTPGKLTERTGALIKMLKDKSPWVVKSRSRSMSGDAMQGNVALTSMGTTVAEEYFGTLSANIKADSKYWPWQSGSISRKRSARPTKQQLLFRFMWETGIRGARRPFLEPAANSIRFSTESLIQAKLDHLEQLGVIEYV